MIIKRVKNSVGIWGFGPNATRFMPCGYHQDSVSESMEERTERAVKGLGELIDGFEFHYPGEINEDNLKRIQKILGKKDIYTIAMGLHCMPEFALGGFTNPKKELRKQSITLVKRAIDLCTKTGSKLIIWPGGEGYNYPFQASYDDVWNYFIEGIQEAVEYANKHRVTVLLEHKNSEPAMRILMRDIGMTMFVINKIKSLGTDVTNVKINMDWQHLIMNGEPLAEYAALLGKENLLGHHHANSGWGTFDDDNMVGASFFMQTLALAVELRRMDYGANGERVGYDLFPYTEDQVEAVKRSILQWEFIYEIAGKIDKRKLSEAQKNKDAVKSYEVVYEALGLDAKFIKELYNKRK
jgi:xylose isomerase